ncbi:hypothetical protein [Pseudidiomarina aestuarii]
MNHNKLSMLISASLLCGALMMGSSSVVAQEVNYNLPSAEAVQARKDSRRNQAVSDRVGRRIMGAFELYSEQEDIKGAIAELEEADPRDPFDRAYVMRFLGNLYAADERTEEAYRVSKEAADYDALGWSDQASALKLTADLALALEKYSDAVEYYGKWLQFTGEYDPEVFSRIATAYYETQQYDKIIKPADMAIQYYEEPNKNPYILKVASYYERKMYSDSIRVLEEGLQVLPGEKTWWNQLGMLYMLEEKIDKALQTLEIAYLAGYFDKESQFKALVQLYSNSEIPFKAGMLMEKHLNSGDIEKTARNYQSGASSYEIAKEYEKAAELYGKAAELEEEREEKAKFYRRQGTAFLRAEQFSNAADAYLKAIDFGIEEPGPVYMSLAESYFYQSKYPDALRYVLEAKKDRNQARTARSWENYIRSKASNKGIDL